MRDGEVCLSLKLGTRPRSVYLAPERTPVPFEYVGGRMNAVVPEVCGHAMVVVE
jgi:hypothetical protein